MEPTSSKPFSYESFPSRGVVAYFSMEIAINPAMPTYSGGLGVLAGDTLRSAADLGVPLVAFTLLHRKGYFQQHLDAERRADAKMCSRGTRPTSAPRSRRASRCQSKTAS